MSKHIGYKGGIGEAVRRIKEGDPIRSTEILLTAIDKGNPKYRDSTYERSSKISEVRDLTDAILCDSAGMARQYGSKEIETHKKERRKLEDMLKEFVSAHTEEIITNAYVGSKEWERTLDSLTNSEFSESLNRLDPDVALALLYEIRITENVAALTSKELFSPNTARFLNLLGPESASEYLNSAGRTGNLSALTDNRIVGNDDIISMAREDAKFASEFSYAVGKTGRIDILSDSNFVSAVGALDKEVRNEYISAIWVTGMPDELSRKSVIERISSGKSDVWGDVVRELRSHAAEEKGVVLISKTYEGEHDRGVKLFTQSMRVSGYDVIYLNTPQSPETLAEIAVKKGVKAVAFSFAGDSYLSLAQKTANRIREMGRNDIAFVGGGLVSESMKRNLGSHGIRLFSTVANICEITSFIDRGVSYKPTSPLPIAERQLQYNLQASSTIQPFVWSMGSNAAIISSNINNYENTAYKLLLMITARSIKKDQNDTEVIPSEPVKERHMRRTFTERIGAEASEYRLLQPVLAVWKISIPMTLTQNAHTWSFYSESNMLILKQPQNQHNLWKIRKSLKPIAISTATNSNKSETHSAKVTIMTYMRNDGVCTLMPTRWKSALISYQLASAKLPAEYAEPRVTFAQKTSSSAYNGEKIHVYRMPSAYVIRQLHSRQLNADESRLKYTNANATGYCYGVWRNPKTIKKSPHGQLGTFVHYGRWRYKKEIIHIGMVSQIYSTTSHVAYMLGSPSRTFLARDRRQPRRDIKIINFAEALTRAAAGKLSPTNLQTNMRHMPKSHINGTRLGPKAAAEPFYPVANPPSSTYMRIAYLNTTMLRRLHERNPIAIKSPERPVMQIAITAVPRRMQARGFAKNTTYVAGMPGSIGRPLKNLLSHLLRAA